MLRRSSLVECVSVLPGNWCLQNVEFCFLRQYVQPCLLKNPKYTFYTIKSSLKLAYKLAKWLLLHTGSGFQWYRTYERGYETSGSHLRFMLRRSSLVECVSVLPGNRCLQNVEFFFLRQYVQPCLLKNPKYTFYTIKSSLKLAYYCQWLTWKQKKTKRKNSRQ